MHIGKEIPGLKIASHVLEAAVEDIAFAGGRFEVKGTDRAIGIFEVARREEPSATEPVSGAIKVRT